MRALFTLEHAQNECVSRLETRSLHHLLTDNHHTHSAYNCIELLNYLFDISQPLQLSGIDEGYQQRMEFHIPVNYIPY